MTTLRAKVIYLKDNFVAGEHDFEGHAFAPLVDTSEHHAGACEEILVHFYTHVEWRMALLDDRNVGNLNLEVGFSLMNSYHSKSIDN